ncbi:MAG TPA: NADH-quinone oxidoreductase subunit C [Planctomycetota bacterium]|nr:NADH-quinone oxidoreductase subunit C [Planctomycetota bacterium]
MSALSAPYVLASNGRPVELRSVPMLFPSEFHSSILEGVAAGLRVSAFFGTEVEGGTDLWAVLSDDVRTGLRFLRCHVDVDAIPSLTPHCPQVHLFEREVAEQFGVRFDGHPWFKPVRYHASWRPQQDAWKRPASEPITVGVTNYYRVDGDEIHEVAVGPIHAGVIEPGHFRFQCHGEEVFHLEISLGYQHRGVERALRGGPDKRTIHYMETLAGDSTIAHATAYARIVEALGRGQEPARSQVLRGIALELERLANHVGDLGALAGDVGYLPTASFCGRLRGDFLNMTATLSGSRFGRGLIRPGGVAFDLAPDRAQLLLRRLDAAEKDLRVAVPLLWETSSVMARFEDIGRLPKEVAISLGAVGPAARACGLGRDIRHDHPAGIYRFSHLPVSTWATGDVFARAFVRWMEVQSSIVFIREQLQALPAGPIRAELRPLEPGRIVATLVEGWRGEVCHVALTDPAGRFARYKVVDPSFHNWMLLAYALRNQQIFDFPLCNKSFGLSYCGHDL